MSTYEQQAKKRRRGPRVTGIVVFVVLVIAGGVWGRAWLADAFHYASTDDASVDGEHVTLSAKMLGRIHEVLVTEGQSVAVGDLCASLDDADLRAQRAQSTAAVDSANLSAELARINLEKAQEDYTRTKELFDAASTTREQFDHVSKALDAAEAQYRISLAQAETARAQQKVVETQLANTRLLAPIPGIVVKKNFSAGDVVQPGQAILTINDLQSVWVTANFEETKIARIRIGSPVRVTVDAYGARVFPGRVTLIGAGIVAPPFSIGEFTKTTQRVPVKILLDGSLADAVLLPGMSVEVKVRAEPGIDFSRFGPAAWIVKWVCSTLL